LTTASPPSVAIVPAPTEAIDAAVRTAIDQVDGLQALRGIRDVLVKPNLGWDLPLPGAVTNGHVIAAVVSVLLDAGHRVTIIEADQVLVDIAQAARHAGVFRLTAEPDVRWFNLSHGDFIDTSNLPGGSSHPIRIPRIVTEHPMVTVPVLKTHAKTVISGAVKNHWALLPIDRYTLHPHLTPVLVDLIRAVPPVLAVMDATIGLEGRGPKAGRPRRVDHILASTDPLSIDAAAAEMIGISPTEVPHLVALADALDRDLPRIAPDRLPPIAPFLRAEHNLVSRIEEALNGTRPNPLFTQSTLFRLMCGGARTWYHAWYHWGPGHRLSQAIRTAASSERSS